MCEYSRRMSGTVTGHVDERLVVQIQQMDPDDDEGFCCLWTPKKMLRVCSTHTFLVQSRLTLMWTCEHSTAMCCMCKPTACCGKCAFWTLLCMNPVLFQCFRQAWWATQRLWLTHPTAANCSPLPTHWWATTVYRRTRRETLDWARWAVVMLKVQRRMLEVEGGKWILCQVSNQWLCVDLCLFR